MIGALKKRYVQRNDVMRQYAKQPSFSDLLPYLEWSDDEHLILLEDGRSVGAAFDLKAVPIEARCDQQIQVLHEKLVRMLAKLLPLERENPWVMQIFVQDDMTLMPLYTRLEAYIAEHNRLDDPLAKQYLKIMRSHCQAMCDPKGIFKDPMSSLPFRGRLRRIRVTLYRRYSDVMPSAAMPDVVNEIRGVCQRFESQLRQVGVKASRLEARHF